MGMQKTLLDQKDKWLTKDLLTEIQKDPELAVLFMNPEYMLAVQQMQHNPKAVMEHYKNNKEFTKALTKLSKLMGNHFHTIGEKEEVKEQ